MRIRISYVPDLMGQEIPDMNNELTVENTILG